MSATASATTLAAVFFSESLSNILFLTSSGSLSKFLATARATSQAALSARLNNKFFTSAGSVLKLCATAHATSLAASSFSESSSNILFLIASGRLSKFSATAFATSHAAGSFFESFNNNLLKISLFIRVTYPSSTRIYDKVSEYEGWENSIWLPLLSILSSLNHLITLSNSQASLNFNFSTNAWYIALTNSTSK